MLGGDVSALLDTPYVMESSVTVGELVLLSTFCLSFLKYKLQVERKGKGFSEPFKIVGLVRWGLLDELPVSCSHLSMWLT